MLMNVSLNFRNSFFSLTAFCLIWTAGCAGPQPTTTLQEVVDKDSAGKQEVSDINRQLFAAVSTAPPTGDYVVGEGDLLEITVFEAQELSRAARVGARGTITLPLVGEVQVEGLTAADAEQKIEDAYRQKYIQDPHVNIFVKEQHGSKITLLGELQKPGTYDYFGNKRLLDVLAMAEGLTKEAGRTIQVSRTGDDPSQTSTFMIDLDQLVKQGQSELNMVIQGGDVIYVPEGGTVYVDGAVMKSGAYPIKQDMTVQQAVVAAGGFSPAASDSVKLVRYGKDGQRDIIGIDADDIAASDLTVQDRDVVFVETNPLKAAVYGFRLQLFGTGVAISPVK
jgi:polysaccharide biosynthesis/export protein